MKNQRQNEERLSTKQQKQQATQNVQEVRDIRETNVYFVALDTFVHLGNCWQALIKRARNEQRSASSAYFTAHVALKLLLSTNPLSLFLFLVFLHLTHIVFLLQAAVSS